MGKFRITAALLLLLAGELVLARPGGAAPERRVSARQLLQTVDSALAGTARAAGSPGGLDPKDPKSSPFWSALNGMRLRVAEITVALERRDGELFILLDQGSSDLGALRVAWARAGAKNAQAGEGLRIASASYRILRANYGREGVRLRQGGTLSEAERRHFQRVQRTQRRFAESLRPLREGSLRRGDRVTAAELDRFRAEAERIAWARLELESYLNALIASGEIRGEWEADAPYLREEAPEDFVVANEMIEDLYVESDIGHVFTVDLGAGGALSHLDQETVLPPAEPEAVQVFQAGSDVDVEEEEPAEPAPEQRIEDVETVMTEDLPPAGPAVDEAVEEEDLEEEAAANPDVDPNDAGTPAPAEPQPADPAAVSSPVPPPIG